MYYSDNSDRALPVITRTNYIREQIFANAVALFPDLVREHARQTGNNGYVDPKEVFQILVLWSQGGWFALLAYGVPRVRHTLVEAKPKYNGEKALERLSWTISEALGTRYPSELGIIGRSRRKLQDGTINRDFF
ncbi:uncharacterized protein RHO25_011668 [Cercospora beticola]|uniref:Uncharacterized protein n=1 Tax=Cercospora beticola TaxID=122368 RepID=A0ABZ0P592_CERBT|nr:hypothetical protein RHO25_011668 [Cercospora beticola]CAK1366945.1 unnamed protein product [Cercospora beticola]